MKKMSIAATGTVGWSFPTVTVPARASSTRPPTVRARKELLTARQMFLTVIGLISINLMLLYIDLSAEDRDLLMAAVAIAGLAGWAYDHFKIDPPDKKD